jgi:ferredoxin
MSKLAVVVDWDLCDGQGECERTAPDIFSLGDAETVTILQPELQPSQRDVVEAAIRACPKAALSLQDRK